jgi:hypothetical protein
MKRFDRSMNVPGTFFAVACSVALLGCAVGVVDEEGETSAPATSAPEPEEHAHVERPVEARIGELVFEQPEEPDAPPAEREIWGEMHACEELVDHYHGHGLDLGCATTAHVCPDLLRFAFDVVCMQYDAESVRDCVARIEDTGTCQELYDVACAVQPVWGSEPQGCDVPVAR